MTRQSSPLQRHNTDKKKKKIKTSRKNEKPHNKQMMQFSSFS